jgi:hypothetical protein
MKLLGTLDTKKDAVSSDKEAGALAASYKIDWKFEPSSYLTGSTYSLMGSIILLLAFFGVGGMELKKSMKEEKEGKLID